MNSPAEVAEDVVLHGFKTGYRHVGEQILYNQSCTLSEEKVDSARVYRNEGPCSDAIKKAGIPRSEVFFTSKVPPKSMGYEKTKASIESSFKQTGLDYIDLYASYLTLQNRDEQSISNQRQIPYTRSIWR